MRLKKHGASQLRLDGEHGWVEALEMTGLKDALLLFGERDEFISFGECGREWFLDEHIEAGFEQCAGYCVMLHGGHGDAGGIEVQVGAEQFFCRSEDGNGVLCRRLRGSRGIRLNGRYEGYGNPGRFKLAIDTKMVAAKGARAGNSDARDGLACYCPAPLPSTALRQREYSSRS